jgi:hypothetical protein
LPRPPIDLELVTPSIDVLLKRFTNVPDRIFSSTYRERKIEDRAEPPADLSGERGMGATLQILGRAGA